MYDKSGEFSANPDDLSDPNDVLVYKLDVSLGGRMQFRFQVDASPADMLGDPIPGNSLSDKYPGIREHYHAYAEAHAERLLERWKPIAEHEKRVMLYRIKWEPRSTIEQD